MDKELKDLLKELNELIGNLANSDNLNSELDKAMKKMSDRIEKDINNAFKEECTISIEKKKNGESISRIEGKPITILITLAGLEKGIMEKLNPPKELWNMIKEKVGVKVVDTNE